jgi:YHS domain-containing protein
MDKKAQWALVGAAWFLAISVAVLGFLGWRHFSPSSDDPKQVYALKTDGSTLCPVTRKPVQVVEATPKVVYQGMTYYFAADLDLEGRDARTRFLMDPEAFLRPAAAKP